MIEIIPAIDIIDGKCVRLYKGDYETKTTYFDNPVDFACKIEENGIRRLHLVDLDGAKKREPINLKILENIAKSTNLIIDFGGGIRKREHIEKILATGAKYITVGSIAASEPEIMDEWINYFGTEIFIISADVRDELISINGWLRNTEISIYDFINYYIGKGIKKFLSTDINKDGTLTGPSYDLYKKIKRKFPDIYLIASGGIKDMSDVELLDNNDIDAVIIGKALLENKITLEQIKEYILNHAGQKNNTMS